MISPRPIPTGVASPPASSGPARAINAAELLQRIRDLGALARIVDLFSQSYPAKLEEVHASLVGRDGSTARRAVHTLKGNFLNFGSETAARVAQALGQAIEQGRWDQVELALPKLAEHCREVESGLRALLASGSGTELNTKLSLGQGFRVVVSDADPANRALCAAVLRGDGFTVLEGSDGQAVLRLLAQEPVDVVLMGVVMQGLDGFDTCRRIKEDVATRMLPVLLLTALDDRDSRVRGMDAGADDFLSKPIDPAEVSLRVRNAARGKVWYDQLQASFVELQQLERLRDGLIGMLVHDLRTPLAAVKGYADLLAGGLGPLTPEQKAIADKMVVQSKRLVDMVASMLTLSRLDSDQLPLTRSEVDLRCLLLAQADLFAGLPEHVLELDLPDAPVLCCCDQALLERVLANLLDNAFKFAPQGQPVRLSLSSHEGRATVEVKDQGPGLPARWQDQIARPRSPFADCQRSWSGLGLAFCQLAVQKHGGEMGAGADGKARGRGARVWFSLPLLSRSAR